MKSAVAVTSLPPIQGTVSTPPSAKGKDNDFRQCLEVASARSRIGQPKTPLSSVHQVQPGETLWGIVRDGMSEENRAPSGTEICEAIPKVAALNGISDPNLIFPGQEIRLALSGDSHAPEPTLRVDGATKKSSVHPQVTRATTTQEIGLFQLPVDGIISSGFGLRNDPIDHELRDHRGVDFAVPSGTPVKAVLPGTVVFSGWKTGYGNLVILQHESGLRTVYAHNQTNLVRQGDKVTDGAAIARVGSTGRSTGSHLHFEVIKNGLHLNPLSLLSPRQGSRLEQLA